jgi:Uma2 family endonuclease
MPVLEAIDIQLNEVNSPKRWTREEAAKLTELFPDKRYELIEGELINKMGQKPPHAYVIAVLTKLLGSAFPGRIRVQSSISLPDPDGQYSEPEPDVVLLHRESPEFFKRHPGPQDIALLIEVADTSLASDRSVKYRLYARAGITEYWIIDIETRRTIVCRYPAADEYKSVTIVEAAETVSLLVAPDFALSLEHLLNPSMS